MAPLHIARGALGLALPRTELILASDQWIRVTGGPVARLLGRGSRKLQARSLLGLEGVTRAPVDGHLHYTRLLLEQEATIFVNGVATDVARFRSDRGSA